MRRTRFGVQLYAIGGNPEAARLSGINVNRAISVNFMIAGLAYGITGIALTARGIVLLLAVVADQYSRRRGNPTRVNR